MAIFQGFLSDFISAFKTNDYISSYSTGKVTGEFFKIFITSLVLVTTPIVKILITNESLNLVLLKIIMEPLQVTGLKLSFYVLLLLISISLICYRFNFLTEVLALLVKLLSNAGFVVNATLAGAFTGVVIVESFIPEISSSSQSIITFYFIIFFLFLIFYLSARIFSTGIRYEIDNALGQYTNISTLIFGILMFLFALYALIDEPWVELIG